MIGTHISVDLPEHAISRAAERLGWTESKVVSFWQGMVLNRQDDLASIDTGHGGRIDEGEIRWLLTRYSDHGVRVMTVIIRRKRRR